MFRVGLTGGIASGTQVGSNSRDYVYTGGSDVGAAISSGGAEAVLGTSSPAEARAAAQDVLG